MTKFFAFWKASIFYPMVDTKHIEKILENLHTYIKKEDFAGYDPYDTLNSFFPFHWFGKWPPVLAIQFQKRNPINIRPILGIRKERNPKAIGLFLEAYSLLYQKYKNPEYLETAHYLFNWLVKNYSEGFSGYCWGYNFPWASRKKFLKAYSPTSVVTGFVCRGIYEYSKIGDTKKASQIINSAANFVLNDIHTFADTSGICFSYTTLEPDVCYNASLLAAEVLSFDVLLNGADHNNKIKEAVNFVLEKQHENGKWNYSLDTKSGKEREQIDFHQGYVIDSLHFINRTILKEKSIDEAILKGTDFYYREQFNEKGKSLFRLPKKWPTDIHNQAQGIITCAKQNKKETAQKVLEYTVKNMLSKRGYFYYKEYKTHKIKTSFMRWSQTWMFLAMCRWLLVE
jgi:hypothetical protein